MPEDWRINNLIPIYQNKGGSSGLLKLLGQKVDEPYDEVVGEDCGRAIEMDGEEHRRTVRFYDGQEYN